MPEVGNTDLSSSSSSPHFERRSLRVQTLESSGNRFLFGNSEITRIMSFKQGANGDHSSDALLETVVSHDYRAEMMEALEQGDGKTLQAIIGHLKPEEINGSVTHSAEGVFSIASVDLPPYAREDLSQRDVITIYPVHYAAMMGYKDCLKILLDAGADPNVKDSLGQTPLHILPKGNWKFDNNLQGCLDVLLAHQKIDANRLDLSKTSPFCRAEQHKWSYMVDKYKEASLNTNQITLADALLNGIIDRNLSDFKNTLAAIENSDTLDENHGSYTLLQLACRSGLYDFVVELLGSRACPITKYDSNILSPVSWATKYGYHRILHLLVRSVKKENLGNAFTECNDMGETPLHLSVMHSNPQDCDEVDYYRCLEILLEKKQYFNIDHVNLDGNTALHCAALCNNIRAYSLLLKEGANSAITNVLGACSMQYISKEDMLQILNDFIEVDDKTKMSYCIKLNYKMINKSIGYVDSEDKEMTFFNSLTKVFQDKDILDHPLFNIFVFLKWMKIRKFFWLNFGIHFIFTALLLTYIFIFHSSLEKQESEHSIIDNDALRMSFAVILLVVLFFREVIQLFMMKTLKEYILEVKNITEIITLVLTILLLFVPFTQSFKMAIAAWLVIFSVLEFILHLGHLRPFAVYITMFREVAWNFFKFICLFSTIILAFGFSFYLMFQVNEKFRSLPESLVKTMIMTTGELEYGDLPISSSLPVATHFMLVVFVFLIMLVLVNLLNGLAVSDIQAIQRRSQVISRMSLVERMTQLEKAFAVENNRNPFKSIFSRLFSNTLIMKSCLPKAYLLVYVNHSDVQCKYKTNDSFLSSICECHGYQLEVEHIKALREIVMRKMVTLHR
ncbi:transient receptor potential channel pyrexia-like [Macrobrachium nipponense]|uniref:transient receptor potential channel pyrexia-like n=1 Tax=Macrobrachium nipponense TaxID=159736 RepID=UPI0030C8A745